MDNSQMERPPLDPPLLFVLVLLTCPIALNNRAASFEQRCFGSEVAEAWRGCMRRRGCSRRGMVVLGGRNQRPNHALFDELSEGRAWPGRVLQKTAHARRRTRPPIATVLSDGHHP